jgi:hypothetical protein
VVRPLRCPAVSRLDEFLPEYEFVERHAVAAAVPAREAVEAAKAATPAEMRLVRMLFALRSLPALVRRGGGLPRARSRPLAEQMVAFGFVPLCDDEDEVILGFVGQPWRVTGGKMPRLAGAEEWLAFDKPGYAKAVMNFRADGARLTTETRVHIEDADSRRRFARYWRVIRPFSGVIRRVWLRAAASRLAAAGRPSAR